MQLETNLFFEKLYAFDANPSLDKSANWKHAVAPSTKSFKSTEKSGKWCLFHHKTEVDSAWIKIKEAIELDTLAPLAKVSTWYSAQQHNDSHVTCIYTCDYTDEVEVKRIRDKLTELGYTKPLKFKRDIDTIEGRDVFIYEY